MWQKVHVYILDFLKVVRLVFWSGILTRYLPNLLRNRCVYYTFASNSREL